MNGRMVPIEPEPGTEDADPITLRWRNQAEGGIGHITGREPDDPTPKGRETFPWRR
jgi:hypothetical protein